MKTKNIYADPTIDFAFKRIFGTERFKAATIGPLNSIIKDVNIVDVSFLNTEISPKTRTTRNASSTCWPPMAGTTISSWRCRTPDR